MVKMVLFLMQNVEDNDYVLDDEPSLDFIITIEYLVGVSTTMTLLVSNNN